MFVVVFIVVVIAGLLLFDLRFGGLFVFGVLLVDLCLLAYALVCCLLCFVLGLIVDFDLR